jgi:rubrerythrin
MRLEEAPPTWRCNEGEAVRDALAIAQRFERQSALFYDSLADQLPAPGASYLRLLARSTECYADLLDHASRDMELRSERSFTLHGAIRSAIQAEHGCAWVYRGLIARTRSPKARSFLESMVQFEHAHVEELEKLFVGLADQRSMRNAGRVAIAKIAPLFRHPEAIDLSAALQIAYESEVRASRNYAALAEQFSGKAAELFLQLSRTEEQHSLAIRETMQSLAA